MNCPTCKHANREGARFCENCGAKIAPVCAQCGHQLRQSAKFCDACGVGLTAEHIRVYTDGGCSGNPGPGAWAFVIVGGKEEVSRSGTELRTTNNRMELKAAINGLRETKATAGTIANLEVHTDSSYVCKGITQWIHHWVKSDWKSSTKDPVKNQELWVELKQLSDQISPIWRWVRGHSGNRYNEICDKMVKNAINDLKQRRQ